MGWGQEELHAPHPHRSRPAPDPPPPRRRARSAPPLAPGTGRAAGGGPRTVSPGGLGEITDAASPCPTISWAGAGGASGDDGYELVVHELAEGAEPRVALREAIDGSALS